MIRQISCLAIALFSTAAVAETKPTVEPKTSISFPASVTMDGTTYQLKGVALRQVNLLITSIKIYAVGYYHVPGNESLKAFRVVAARDMGKGKIVDALEDAVTAKLGSIPESAAKMFAALSDSAEGEVTFYYNTTDSAYFRKQGNADAVPFADKQVAEAIYDSWISEKLAVDQDMRRNLLNVGLAH